MSTKVTANMIKKYGCCDQRPSGRIPGVYSVICQKCGKKILSTSGEELSDVGYSITKRGTANFWHESCKGDAWNSRIKWEEKK